jgi:hypothetical protein
MEKEINGRTIRLIPGLKCINCMFHNNRECMTDMNDCLDVPDGAWKMVPKQTEPKPLEEDPLFQ